MTQFVNQNEMTNVVSVGKSDKNFPAIWGPQSLYIAAV